MIFPSPKICRCFNRLIRHKLIIAGRMEARNKLGVPPQYPHCHGMEELTSTAKALTLLLDAWEILNKAASWQRVSSATYREWNNEDQMRQALGKKFSNPISTWR
jgi:hypothetical protein